MRTNELFIESLRMLRCVHTHSGLRMANASECRALNAAIGELQAFDQLGRCVTRLLDGALINELATFAYPIHDEIPHLLAETSIPLDAVPGEFER